MHCVFACVHVHVRVCVCACVYVHVCVGVCVSVCVCVYTSVCEARVKMQVMAIASTAEGCSINGRIPISNQ